MEKQLTSEESPRPRVLARVLSEDLLLVRGGGATVTITEGPPRDITNVGGDGDVPLI